MRHIRAKRTLLLAGGLLILSPAIFANLDVAFGNWQVPPAASQPAEPVDADRLSFNGKYTVDFRKLTPKEINRIRYMELRGMRLRTEVPDRVTVKIPKGTVDDFLVEMEGHEEFHGDATRREFRKLMPPQKLHQIAMYMKEAYADKVDLLSDPEVFVEFKKNVMPVVARGCATNGCHASGAGDEVKFRLFKDPKKTAETMYANFLILDDIRVGPERVINRAQVSDSLLLTYMLPPEEVKPNLRHPGKVGPKPMFRGRGALGYKRIERWIGTLKNPPSDYGVHLIKPELDDLTEGLEPASTSKPAIQP